MLSYNSQLLWLMLCTHERERGMQLITIKDIAVLAKVSRTTVSRVLNDSGYVSVEARQRVMKAIEETGYVPSQHAKSLRTKKTKVIGVILPKISTETSSRVVFGMDEVFSKQGYQILLMNTNLDSSKEIPFLKLLKSRQVDGIILVATNINDKLLEEIYHLKIPFVVVGQEIPNVPSVVYDDYNAARAITKLFLKKGRRKLAFIGVSEKDKAVGIIRKQGFLDELRENKLQIPQNWLEEASFEIESGYAAMKRIIESSEEPPTGVFAVSDRLAIGAMQFLKERGYVIPTEVALAGIGDSDMSKYVQPALTTIDYESERAGRESAAMILAQVNQDQKKHKKIILDYRLIERDSI